MEGASVLVCERASPRLTKNRIMAAASSKWHAVVDHVDGEPKERKKLQLPDWVWPAINSGNFEAVKALGRHYDWESTDLVFGTPLTALLVGGGLNMCRGITEKTGLEWKTMKLLAKWLCDSGSDPEQSAPPNATTEWRYYFVGQQDKKSKNMRLAGKSALRLLFEILDEATYGRDWRCQDTAKKLTELINICIKNKSEKRSFPMPKLEIAESTVDLWDSIYSDKEHADLIFELEGGQKQIKAHSNILFVASPVLKAMCTHSSMREHSRVIQVEDSESALEAFLRLVYTGYLDDEPDVELLLGVLELSCRWNVPHVTEIIEVWLIRRVDVDTFEVLLEAALLKQLAELLRNLEDFAAEEPQILDAYHRGQYQAPTQKFFRLLFGDCRKKKKRRLV
eukprot:GEMP01038741.1.p1 GENE.GEMP01038741.1~~GEMP01038741.1.p1  ORF type:complete len:394 (+),score=86.14 GEMP01038741.1:106-1287(+)